jgi:disulfide bond formation protein DsbB
VSTGVRRNLAPVSTEAMQVFFSILTIVAIVGSLALVWLRISLRWSERARPILADVHRNSLWLGFLVALVATLGSLYFSEIAEFAPCKLCWYQRIAMYPLAVLLLVAAIRKEYLIRWYVLPISLIGLGISAYHYLIEWRPDLDSGTCDLFGPSCTDVWFKEFGFITLAFMAAVGFLSILALLFAPIPATLEESDDVAADAVAV